METHSRHSLMSSQAAPSFVGKGSPEFDLSPDELRGILEHALMSIAPSARVLAIIPDKTRDDNTDVLFPFAAEILAARNIAQFDALVAQGTHMPMTEAEKFSKIGLATGKSAPGLGQVYDHRWNVPEELVTIGELSAARVRELTGGLLDDAISVNLNRLLSPGVYDTVLIFSATVPHEVAGFAGGAKYFFPGVAGPDLTHALFVGDFREAFRRAAEVSRHVHIKYTGRKYKRVVALLDEHYDELWVGGKASYKLGGIIEDGGELIIFAPHLRALSQTHGALIEKYGYAPLESVRDMLGVSQELRENLCIAAHLAHVAYAGRIDEEGHVVPRYQITMASGIDEATCKRVNLGFIDYRTFDYGPFESDSDTLIVKNAGRDLYK